jgi:hypothetical protein
MNKNNWKSVDKELPEPKKRLKLSFGFFGARAAVCDQWESEGWLTKSGRWSVKWREGMPKYPKPTHWKYIDYDKIQR